MKQGVWAAAQAQHVSWNIGVLLEVVLDRQYSALLDVDVAVDLIRHRAAYVWWYDALDRGSPHEVQLGDLAIPAYLAAVPHFKSFLNDRERLVRVLRDTSDALRAVPDDTDLHSWSLAPEAREVMSHLYSACLGRESRALPGYGIACCTKLLHKKRPRLVPILDKAQLSAWAGDGSSETARAISATFALAGHLAEQEAELRGVVQRLCASDSDYPVLSILRVYDILGWELRREPWEQCRRVERYPVSRSMREEV